MDDEDAELKAHRFMKVNKETEKGRFSLTTEFNRKRTLRIWKSQEKRTLHKEREKWAELGPKSDAVWDIRWLASVSSV